MNWKIICLLLILSSEVFGLRLEKTKFKIFATDIKVMYFFIKIQKINKDYKL